ncbi:MAG: RrF2 family transcriptional regulator [Desulfitobacteriia bacterium]
MRFSTRGRYGVHIMVDLAQHADEGPISLKSVAERQKLSEHYLEQLIPELRKAGLVKSIRGSQGGYILAKRPEDILIGDVIRVLEGPIAPVECTNQLGLDCCEKTDFCVTREVWVKVRDSINNVVDSITLADLIKDTEKDEEDKINLFEEEA